ncbi:MAG: hypothetical protein R3332_08185 [Pseudohongiellaceae bacterium]|nr:hypothetical protein [Pseudohongiellaceae bacterium]
MKKARISIATLFALVLTGTAAAGAGAAPTSLSEGVYTAEQAESGKPLFEKSCNACHNADFYKTVLQTWRGEPMQYLFEQVMSAMPADNPGSLYDTEYEQIFAHILELVGFPAGDTELSYSSGMMMDVEVESAP